MPVVIREITSEVALESRPEEAPRTGGAASLDDDELIERIVRRAARRVIEQLRMEWGP